MNFSRKRTLAAVLLFFLFIFLTTVSASSPYFRVDLLISTKIQNIHNSFFDILMRFVSSVGSGRVMPVTAVALTVLLAYLQMRVEAFYLILSSMFAYLTGSLTKIIVNRPRPSDDLVLVYKNLSDNSFPSSHVLVYTVLFGFLFFISLKQSKDSLVKYPLMIFSAVILTSIGLSRIYLGAHWASDVLGGYLLGVLFLFFTINIYSKNHGKR